MVDAETQIDFAQAIKAANQQPRGDKQYKSRGNLGDNKGGAESSMASGPCPRAASILQACADAGVDGGKRGDEPTRETGQQREPDGQGNHLQVKNDGTDPGSDSGKRPTPARRAASVRIRPKMPPAALCRSASTRDRRMTEAPLAPSAKRTAISRRWRMTRTSNKPARLTHKK